VLLGLLLVLVLLLAGCGGEPTAVPTEPPPTEVAVQPTTPATEPPAPTDVPTEPPPTAEPTEPPPTEAPTEPPPTATPTEEPTPEPVDDTACVACHTDEETLKSVAEEPEETEALSEGEG
jgi:outer membrane biosynthesis protein TonB